MAGTDGGFVAMGRGDRRAPVVALDIGERRAPPLAALPRGGAQSKDCM